MMMMMKMLWKEKEEGEHRTDNYRLRDVEKAKCICLPYRVCYSCV